MRGASLKFWAIVTLGLAMSLSAYAAEQIDLSGYRTQVQLLDQNQSEMIMEVELSSLNIVPVSTRAGEFVLLTADKYGYSNKIGEPNLPVARKIISVPFGCELDVSIIGSDFQEIALADYGISNPIMPVQPPLSKSDDPEDVEFVYDRELYEKSGYYALPTAEGSVMGVMRSVNLGMIEISPVEYDPVSNKIKVYSNLKIKVSYSNPDWLTTREMQVEKYSPSYEVVYNRIFNYQQPSSAILDTISSYPIKYLIVSDRMFESQLQDFIDWKTMMGYTVIVGYTDVIGSTTSSIKSWIQNQYNSPGDGLEPSFVLLVGDTPEIPSWDGDAGSHVTDMKYVDFTDDDFPEIFIGRFSAQSTGELQPQIDKTLEYEQYLMPDPSYLAEVTLIVGVDGTYAQTHGNGQINYGTTYYFNAAHGIIDHTWLYPASNESGASAAIIQTVDDGVGFINYTAHCGHSGFSDPSFTVSDINGLTNEHKYLLGIGNCCQSNTFDESTPCFGEAWLQAEDKGGVGYIGGSNSTTWDEDYWWGVGADATIDANPTYEETGLGAYDGIFHDHGEAVSDYHIYNSAVIYCANMAVDEGGGHSQYYWEIYHLMGDPSLINYMGVPSANSVSHSSTVILTASSLQVSADPGSYVGISMNGDLHGAAYVGASGTVNVPLSSFSGPGTADIVVTGQNRQPYISTIQVITPSGPYVILDSYDINDVAGNNNGEVDAGESIVLGVQVINVGPDDANNVSASLSSSSSYVTISDNSEYYGTVDGDNGISYSSNAFAFTVSGDAPDGYNIPFELEITGTTIDLWASNFTIPVHAPDLGLVSVSVNDASGNNNGVLDPGETASIIVTISNAGSGSSYNVSGVLSENDGYVSVGDANGYFGTINSNGGTADNSGDTYSVTASSGTPQGYEVTFDLDLNDDLGASATVNFDLVIGDRSVVFFDDFSYDQGWSGLGGIGEWTIGAATGGSGADSYGGPDPSADHTNTTDNGVLGNDISSSDGDYNIDMEQTYWVYSPIIDCMEYTSVIMSYYHWLGIESNTYDNVYFEVYDGSSWVNLFANTSSIDEGAWIESDYDLTAYADENPDFQIRFGIGETDGSWNYCGWNIDDIEIKGYFMGSSEPPDLAYDPESFTDSLDQDDTSVQQLTVNNNGTGNLRFRLSSSDSWLEFDNTLHNIAPGSFYNYDITINSTGMESGDHTGSLAFTSNDPDTPSGTIPVDLHIYYPDIFVTQSSVHEILESGEQSIVPLIVENNGDGTLDYTVDHAVFENTAASLSLSAQKTVKGSQIITSPVVEPIGYHSSTIKSKEREPIFPPMTSGYGGPDAFGYSWKDSDETGGPVYSWVDITSVGTEITGIDDDANVGPYDLGFDFDFYGETYDSFRFCTNGFISFTSTDDEYSNVGLPTGGAEPMNIIAPFWDDMNFEDGGTPYYYTNNIDSLVVSWENVAHFDTGGTYTYQVILQSNGKITFQYQTLNWPLNSTTIGIQNSNATIGLQVAYNQDYIHSNMAILINAGTEWLDVNPTSGSVAGHNSCTIELLFDAADLPEGDYDGQVTISSNDPDSPVIDIPVTLSIGLDGPVIQLTPVAINDTVIVGHTADTDLIISNTGTLDLEFTIADNAAWISESIDSGTIAPEGSTTSVVTLNATTLPEGSYSGQITVNSNAVNESSAIIPVSMLILPPPPVPSMTLNLTEISETVVEGENVIVELIIGNDGTGELTYSLADDAAWMTESPVSGSVDEFEADTVAVTLDGGSLTEGEYTATLTITSNDTEQDTTQIPITLDIVPGGPMCEYMPGDLNSDGTTIGSDITFAVSYFRGNIVPADSCYRESNARWLYVAGDVNGDCQFIGSDVTYYVNYFRGISQGLQYCPELPPYEPPLVTVPSTITNESDNNEVVPAIIPEQKVKTDKLK